MPSSTTTPTSAGPARERVERTQVVVPANRDDLLQLFQRAVELPAVKKIEVTPKGLSITRAVEEGEEVLPDTTPIDPQAVLEVAFALEVTPHAHPFLTVQAAFDELVKAELTPIAWLAPAGPLLGAFLGREDAPRAVLGLPVHYLAPEVMLDRVAIIGGASSYLIHAKAVVIINPWADQ